MHGILGDIKSVAIIITKNHSKELVTLRSQCGLKMFVLAQVSNGLSHTSVRTIKSNIDLDRICRWTPSLRGITESIK